MRFIPVMNPILGGGGGGSCLRRVYFCVGRQVATVRVSTLQGADFSQMMKWVWAKLIPNS